ncbi:MAG: hypothetical protein IPF54_05760 [Draconibacterium sp.]|nr:hypothetical protein [Draconibacterium sp.]
MNNKINFIIPEEVLLESTQKLNEATELLKPYLIALTPRERKTIPKMSDKTVPFVEKNLEYCETAPQFAPPYMDSEALYGDMKVTQQLTPLFRTVKALNDGLDDTIMEAGGEAFVNALSYYNSVKNAAKSNIPGAKSIYDDLKKRFEREKTGNGTPPAKEE